MPERFVQAGLNPVVASVGSVFVRRWDKAVSDRVPAVLRPQRLLWARTSTKNPQAPDVLHISALDAPFTINTMPAATLLAFADHGRAARHGRRRRRRRR